MEVSCGWMEPVIELMERDEKIAVCQPKILSYTNKDQFEYAGACGGWIDKYAYPFSRGRIFDVCETDEGQYNDVSQVFWATGAAFFVKSGIFHATHGFDEYFFAHQEEIDLCWRIQLAGYKIFVHPASVVYHVGGGTLPMGDRRKVFLNFRNNLIMLSKNNSFSKALLKVPFRLVLDNIAAVRSLFRGEVTTWFAIIKAHVNFLKWLFFERHKSVFAIMKSGNLYGIYKGSVIWQYFIKRRRKFKDIVGQNV